MEKAFTMLEVIFVIVIIGILAAVAVPRLSATKDDATVVKVVQSTVQALHNLGASYVAKGDYSNYSLTRANSEAECFTYTAAVGAEGNVTVHLKASCISTAVRSAVAAMATQNGLLGTAAADKTFQFEGQKVKF